MLQHIAGAGKISEAKKKKKVRLWLDQCGFFIVNEESRFQARSPIGNYRSIPDVVEPNGSAIFTEDVTPVAEENIYFNKRDAAKAHLGDTALTLLDWNADSQVP